MIRLAKITTQDGERRSGEQRRPTFGSGLINIFTITFQANNAALQAVYRDCASAANQYFNSPTAAELQQVFRQIGSQISNLRLEK